MTMRNGLVLFTSLCLILLCNLSALAQSQTTGRITGTIKDPRGAVVAGATITATNKATGEERSAVTDDGGVFSVPLLPPGDYKVRISAKGFSPAAVESVRVAITESATINADLKVGDITGTAVTVTDTATLVQNDTSQLGRVIGTRAVSELPLGTRNFTQLLGLTPGAATYLPDNTAVGRGSQNISVNGGRVTNNNYQINGIDSNSIGTNSAPSLSVPAPETIQEFKVQTSLYDATFGRSGGGNLQVLTKSGGNQFHGAVYDYLRNDSLNANNPFLKAAGVARPVLSRNVFGGTLGGPIRKDKAFFFVSYQNTHERNGASIISSLSSNVLVAPGLTNDRSNATLLATFHPTSLFTGLPVSAINSTTLSLLNTKLDGGQFLIPTPQAGGTYSGSAISKFDENQFNANFDYKFSDKHLFSSKFFFSNGPQVLQMPAFLGRGPNVPGFGVNQVNNNRLFVLQDTYTFSPTLINEARIGINFLRVNGHPQEPVKDSDIGITRSNAAASPGLGLIQINPSANGVAIGTAPLIDVQAFGFSMTFADTISYTRGKHFFRFGTDIRYNQNNSVLNGFSRGQIVFNNFNDFLAGIPFLTVFAGGINTRSFRVTDYHFFAQDDWKVTPKLTLNLGLRYELDPPATDTRGRIATFDPALYVPRPAVGGAVIGPPLGGYVQSGNVIPAYDSPTVPNVNDSVVNSIDPNNFAPRIGFAYSPLNSGRLAIRGGYGIFYSRTSLQYAILGFFNPPTYVLGARVLPPLSDPFFAVPPPSQFPTFVPGIALSGTFFDRNIRTPYLHHFNVNAQYEIVKDLMLEAGYVGTRGRNLFRQVAINQARLVPTGGSITNAVTGAVITTNTPANAALRAPFQGVGNNNFFQDQSTAKSNYNSLQVSLTKRFSKGMQFLAAYTWAKSIDNASGQGGGGGLGGVIDPGAVGETSAILGNQFDDRANRGVSDFDRTHRFVLSYLWELPTPSFARDSNAGRLLLGNWQLGGIITAMSGLPIDIVDTGAGSFYGLSGGTTVLARPNLVGSPFSNVPAGYYFNPLAFARPTVAAGAVIPSSGGAATAGAIGTDFGNVGRNLLRGPGQNNVDFSIFKRFPIGETKNIEFRTEFFNLFNHVNLANPLSDFNAGSSFGRITAASNNPRIIQFALKFNY